MRQAITVFIALFTTIVCHSQDSALLKWRGEFATEPNGLMYSDASMKQLRHMVDSLNLRFKSCDLTRTYYSWPQSKIRIVKFSSKDDLRRLRKDLDAKIPLDSLLKKYRRMLTSIDTTQTVVVITRPKEGKEETWCLVGTPSKGYDTEEYLDGVKLKAHKNSTDIWFYHFWPIDKYQDSNEVWCYQLSSPLHQQAIPDQYAHYIQYVDCMVDTNTTVMLGHPGKSHRFNDPRKSPLNDLVQYINREMKLTRKTDSFDYDYLTQKKYKYAVDHLKQDENFMELLEQTIEACEEQHTGSYTLEELVGDLISRRKALDLMRSRIVVGMCSMDQSPRLHARNIALLAAETNSWDVFLRAHLDIMNDRFERRSDGSYAWNSRKTYLKELEELDLNVIDLMMGLSLRAEGLAENHYNGTVWRVGKALAESKDREVFEKEALCMMQDPLLDGFNRGLICILLQSYLDNLGEAEKKEKTARWKNAFENI